MAGTRGRSTNRAVESGRVANGTSLARSRLRRPEVDQTALQCCVPAGGGGGGYVPVRTAANGVKPRLWSRVGCLRPEGIRRQRSIETMEHIRPVVRRFPRRELEVRRCWNRDEKFRVICLDYAEADQALRHWQAAVHDGGGKRQQTVDDYANLLKELEEEIRTHLDRSLQRHDDDGLPASAASG